MRSDQLDPAGYDTDKFANGYLPYYDEQLSHLAESRVDVFELGIHRGGSLHLWQDYFADGVVVGIDLKIPENWADSGRIRTFAGAQTDKAFLSRVAGETAPEGFDLIVDDASHLGWASRISFWHLFDNHLKPGGLYAIEDYGTGYYSTYRDGHPFDPAIYERATVLQRLAGRMPWLGRPAPMPNHSYGMVGFVKQLVDEQAAEAVTRSRPDRHDGRDSKFASLLFTPSIVFVRKADAPAS